MSHSFLLQSGGLEHTRNELEEDHESDLEYVKEIQTDSHHPIPHCQFLSSVEMALSSQGIGIKSERHGTWGHSDDDKPGCHIGLRYFGQLTLEWPDLDGWAPALVLRNAHDKAFSMQVNYGNDTLICDNLLLTGILLAMHKHTSQAWVEFNERLNTGIGTRLVEETRQMQVRMEKYEDTRIDEGETDHLIMEATRRKIIAPSATLKVNDEYNSDEHKDMHGAYTVESLLNAFTSVMKGRIVGNPRPSYALTGLLDDFAGVSLRAAA